MNLRLIVTAFQVIRSTREQYKEEAEQFDEEYGIKSPISKGLSHGAVLLKIIGLGLIMGDFDFLDELVGNKWIALMTLLVIGIPILILLGFMSEGEKEDNRERAHKVSYQKMRSRERKRVIERRKKRERSNVLVDLGS